MQKRLQLECIGENSKYLESVADTSVTECDEISTFMDIISTKMTNNIPTNVTSTASINCNNKKIKRLLYFAYSSITIMLLLIMIIICFYHAKQKSINELIISNGN